MLGANRMEAGASSTAWPESAHNAFSTCKEGADFTAAPPDRQEPGTRVRKVIEDRDTVLNELRNRQGRLEPGTKRSAESKQRSSRSTRRSSARCRLLTIGEADEADIKPEPGRSTSSWRKRSYG